MGIYRPDLALTRDDREALLLLAQLVLATDGDSRGNLSPDAVTLSPTEAKKLLELLEQFSSSKLFVEGSFFAEGMANGDGWHNDRLREIYLSWRSRRWHSRVMSGATWREFVFRLGFNASQNAWVWPSRVDRSPLRPMTLPYFLAMEKKLLSTTHLHPRVAELVVNFVEQGLPEIKNIQDKNTKIREGSIRSFVMQTTHEISEHVGGNERSPMTRKKIIALSTIIMDTAVLFTTRDWTAAGVLSSIAAVVPDALNK